MTKQALLVLEDGTKFRGTGFGADGEVFGEIVFNTGMTGYQETLTDPSYAGQIVTMTAPHIGNTGVNDTDPESRRVWVSGYVVRDLSPIASSWRAQRDLDTELKDQGIPGIEVTATRALTMRVREHGAMRAAVSTIEDDPDRLLARVLASPGMVGADLARQVTTPEPYIVKSATKTRYRVVAVDLGIKASTPRYLAERGCEVHVVPAMTTAREIQDLDPDGVFFSNGPGDPAAADYAVETMRGVLDAGLPVFGICFGSQILSLALGLETYKLKYGHRGVNQPVMDLSTGKVYITSHNHGFAAALPTAETAEETGLWRHVPRGARQPFATPYGEGAITHVNLNDGVVEGIRLLNRPVFAVQYHPESAPGPHDAVDLFDQFCQSMSTVDVTSTGIERGRCHIDRGDHIDRGARDDRGAAEGDADA